MEAQQTGAQRVAELHRQARADYGTWERRAVRQAAYDQGIADAQDGPHDLDAVAVALAGAGR
ncbi:hypothetical protein PV392_27625 [Streptomyces sp. ME03-5709C]|nr:hypothetical protein [Streptomyces sp. ME03-5709C]